jgi:beta-lactam-binding protein with PASTA domain
MRGKFFAALVIGVLFSTFGASAADITIGTGTGTWNYPLSTNFHDARTQTIYLASEIGGAKTLNSLALNVSTKPGQVMNYFTIRLKHTNLSAYGTSPIWESSGWTTVYQANQTISTTGWGTFPFTTPFDYNGTQNLMVDISFNNSSYTSYGYCYYTSSNVNRSIYYRTNSSYGDPLTWTNSTPPPTRSTYFSNIRLGYVTSVVPDVVGMTQAAAQAAITTANLVAGSVTPVFNESVPAGNVISQSPVGGQTVASGIPVNLVISLGEKYSGSGTTADPYRITNKAELLAMTYVPADYDKCFVLMADIDLAGQTYTKAIIAPDMTHSYSPSYDGTAFTGTFDGNGHTIRNLTINSTNSYIGLFGNVGPTGQIQNLNLETEDLLGGYYVGGLTGCNSGTITNCAVSGSVSGTYDSEVDETFNVGGLIGYNSGIVTNCSANAYVRGGGFSYNIGGLIGQNSSGTVTKCYAVVEIPWAYDNTGGLVGYNNSGTIINCYAAGSLPTGGWAPGGFVGNNSGHIDKCYSTCHVPNGGGLVAGNTGTVTNSFWDIETSGQSVSAGGTGKTTAEMQTLSTFTLAGWDFSTNDGDLADWYIHEADYPQLNYLTASVSVPNVIGMSQAEAQSAITLAGLTLGSIAYALNDVVPAGSVISHSPISGQLVFPETPVNLIISLGEHYSGSGTASDPYQIATKWNLLAMAAATADYDKCFVLTTDIDLQDQIFKTAIIGSTSFTGVFDGNDYKIKNVTINGGGNNCLGLFGQIGSAGKIKNLGLTTCSIAGTSSAIGGLAGINQGTIVNCNSNGSITGGSSAGGLIGSNSGWVNNCYSIASISGSSYVGGLIGRNQSELVSNCYAIVNVNGSSYVGGLVGTSSSGNINNCYSTGSVSGSSYVAGLAGEGLSCNINNCYSACSVTGTASSEYVGGLVGSVGNITNCYSTGSVSGYRYVGGLTGRNGKSINCYSTGAVTGSQYVGGLAGYNYYGTISNCYSTGIVRGASNFGGLVGNNSGGVVDNSFWDIQISGQASSAGGTGKTTTAMKMLSTFTSAGWDFSTARNDGDQQDWILVSEGTESPRLRFQIPYAYRSGNGTTDNPYQIADANDLLVLSDDAWNWNKHFIMTNDIDMTEVIFSAAVIAPSASASQGIAFTGSFNGNGHKISNLTCMSTAKVNVGLFGCIFRTTIENLCLENVNISTNGDYTGGLVGYQSFGTINNCYIRGTISASSASSHAYTSGLVGYQSSGLIINSYCMGAVSSFSTSAPYSASYYAGGLVGFQSNGTVSDCHCTNTVACISTAGTTYSYAGGLIGSQYGVVDSCFSTGSITSSAPAYAYAGGLVGIQSNGTILNCWSIGNVTTLYSSNEVLGGLVGQQYTGTINSCYNAGSVNSSASASVVYAGGLVGSQRSGTISNCYNAGSVFSSAMINPPFIGGLVGGQVDTLARIENCYSTGKVSGNLIANNAGGLLGIRISGTVVSSYWDTQTSGMTISAGGTGKTTAQMKSQNTFTSGGWDFSDTDGDPADWKIESNSYPRLRWEDTLSTVNIPDVTGMTQTQAESVLNDIGLFVGKITSVFDNTIPDGCVINQSPVSGSSVFLNTLVDIRISRGKSYFDGGDGLAENPYLISTSAQMNEIGLHPQDWDKCFKVVKDIDMSDYNGTQYNIIGTDSYNRFTGTFDGNGYKIRNLNYTTTMGVESIGLFGYTVGATILNLSVEDVNISTISLYTGGLMGYQSGGTITNCSITGIVHTFNSSYFPSSYVGGLVGNQSGGAITNSYSMCQIDSSLTSSVYRSLTTGGLVGGEQYGSSITNSYFAGSITATSSFDSIAGGLAGSQSGGTITDCYSTGIVNSFSSSSSSSSCAGGLVGYQYSSSSSIERSYSTGQVNATGNTIYKGGLLGKQASGNITACFWDILTSGISTSTGGSGVQGKTTTEMKTLLTFTSAGWDFINGTNDTLEHTWFIREGQEYPRLMWKIENGQSGLFSAGFVIINKTRVGRTSFEYELAVRVRNSNTFAMNNVQMKLMDWDAAVQSVSDDSITIDTIPAGATVASTDTFKIVVDRSTLINSSRLVWELTYYTVASGDEPQQAMMSMLLSDIDSGVPGDISGDGEVNLEDLALMSAQWNTTPGTPPADIAKPLDNYVGIEDLMYLADNWMN